MKVLITGGAGFLGQALAAALLARGELRGADDSPRRIDQVLLLDVVAPPASGDARVRTLVGDLADPAVLEQAVDADTTAVFHLAAVVSGQAEADFDLGMRINLDASRALLERCRAVGHRPRVVFTSSVAVYGGPLPAQGIQDGTALTPQSSYGTQKAIGELLLADYSRKGFVDGRCMRLPTICVRPGRPNQAASSFVSGMVREPLHGQTCVVPVAPDVRVWVSSPERAIDGLIQGHELDEAALGGLRSVNMPGLSVTVGEMAAALERVAGREATRHLHWEPDATITRIVGSWPGAWDCQRALGLGLRADTDFDTIVRAYQALIAPPD